MILSTHDLRSHISRRSWRVLRILRCPLSRDTKVGDSHVTVRIHEQVLRFNISMNDTVVVHVLKTDYAASNEEFGLLLWKPLYLTMMVTKIAASDQIGNQIQIFVVLKRIEHVDEEGVLQLAEQLLLINDGLNTFLVHNSCLWHLFHGVSWLKFSAFNFPYLLENKSQSFHLLTYPAESSLSDNVVELEVTFVNGCE